MTGSTVRLGKTIFALLLLACVSALRAEIHPIVEVKSGVLLGASAGQKWLNGKQAGKQFKPGLSFRIFDLGKEVGATKARKVEANMDICPDVEVVSFEETPSSGEIALAAAWKALPRPVRIMDTTQASYRSVVRDFLVGRGFSNPDVNITQILQADLDGDGEDEVLLSATNYEAEENSAPASAQAGNYSFVLLRQSRGGKMETKLVSRRVLQESRHFEYPVCPSHPGDSRPGWRRQNGTRFDQQLLRGRHDDGLSLHAILDQDVNVG